MPIAINNLIDLKEPVFLIGMMGSWKTTIGKNLAKKTNLKFIDIDDEIQLRTSKSIAGIFKDDGEAYFRKMESKVLREGIRDGNKIISTGGGMILMSENRSLLITKGYTIYLKASIEILVNRISNVKKRPLLKASQLREQLNNILKNRKLFYEDVADFTLDTDLITSDDATQLIINHLRTRNAKNSG